MILIIKANVLQHKVEPTKEMLEEALPIVRELKSTTLIKFVETCLYSAEEDYNRRMSSIASARFSKISASITPENFDFNEAGTL